MNENDPVQDKLPLQAGGVYSTHLGIKRVRRIKRLGAYCRVGRAGPFVDAVDSSEGQSRKTLRILPNFRALPTVTPKLYHKYSMKVSSATCVR